MNNNKDFIEYLEFLVSNRIHPEYSLIEIKKEIEDKIKELKSEGCGELIFKNDTIKCGEWSQGDRHYCKKCFAKGRKEE